MATRVTLLRLGWGYAMLGPPLWTLMLAVVERPAVAPPGQSSLVPLLLGAGVVAIAVSALVPPIVRRSKALRALFLPKATALPETSDEERGRVRTLREARAFDIYLVSWVISLLGAVVAGMLGLMLGYLRPELLVSYAFIAAAFVLTGMRFPRTKDVREALERW